MKTAEAARGKWPAIFRHFGVVDKYLNPQKHSDCPLCGEGKDRYRFADRDGSGNFFCNQCHPNGGGPFDFLIQWTGKSFKDLAREIDGIVGNIEIHDFQTEKRDPRIRLNQIAAKRAPIDTVNPVRAYLKSRGLKPVPGIEYCTAVDYWQNGERRQFPAMVCVIRGTGGAPLTWHVTHLTQSGEKAPVEVVKKILPPVKPITGGAIRLGGEAPLIGIAEGIETALAVSERHGIVCWAATSAGQMEKFQPPSEVTELWIFGDNDKSFTGQKAAYTLAYRLRDRLKAKVFIPDQPGTDFADEYGESAA